MKKQGNSFCSESWVGQFGVDCGLGGGGIIGRLIWALFGFQVELDQSLDSPLASVCLIKIWCLVKWPDPNYTDLRQRMCKMWTWMFFLQLQLLTERAPAGVKNSVTIGTMYCCVLPFFFPGFCAVCLTLNVSHCFSLTNCFLFVLQGRWWKKSALATSSVVIIALWLFLNSDCQTAILSFPTIPEVEPPWICLSTASVSCLSAPSILVCVLTLTWQ